ncbi:phosducin-like protein 2 [Elephas maximus indicus]|uniref:phosducin-like protein 2 n=1 Tax=Elephas maximus indicus TaxID=99487 RepID=UPI0021168B87|nr:phosducin-like protein 2 [Elephas maximus indicus]
MLTHRARELSAFWLEFTGRLACLQALLGGATQLWNTYPSLVDTDGGTQGVEMPRYQEAGPEETRNTGNSCLSLKTDPNEDTEWNEILRDFGILPPKEEPEDEIEEMVLRLQKEAMVKPYERMNLAQLKEAEDEFDDEDMRAIEIYREKRLQEWKALKKKQKFGELREISGNQYVKEVTNAEEDVWVIVHLYRSSITMCLLVNQHLSLLARKFPETKFVKAIVNSCIQHYHDNCLPTIFVYKNGQIEGKFIGVIECGGINLKLEELEWKLAEVGAIQTDLEENPKKGIVDVMVSSIRNTSIYNDSNNSNSNNDDTK